MSTLIGTSGVVAGAPRYVRDANGYWTTIRTWMGLQDELLTLGDLLDGSWEIQQVSGPVYRLTATSAGRLDGGSVDPNAQVVTVWQLKIQQQRRDLWELPKVRTELEKLTDPAGRSRLLADLRALAAGEVVTVAVNNQGTVTNQVLTLANVLAAAASVGVNTTILTEFVLEMGRGVDSYMFDTFVLTKKRVGSVDATSLLPSFSTINLPVTTGSLLASEASIPTAIRTPIAAQLSAGFWLRQGDELNQLDSDRIEINSQWVFGTSFSTFIYG